MARLTSSLRYPFGTIRDWHQYYLDLEALQADKNARVDYQLEYQASKFFNVNHFDATGMQRVFYALQGDRDVHARYVEHAVVNTNTENVDEET